MVYKSQISSNVFPDIEKRDEEGFAITSILHMNTTHMSTQIESGIKSNGSAFNSSEFPCSVNIDKECTVCVTQKSYHEFPDRLKPLRG